LAHRPSEQNAIPDQVEAPPSAADKVAYGILDDLEFRRLAPGQRLIETDLAERYGVGRNAVREAIQRLAASGLVDLSRHRSPAVRRLDLAQAMDALEVTGVIFALLAKVAARNFDPTRHGPLLQATIEQVSDPEALRDLAVFNRARRSFYGAMVEISGSGELAHILANLRMQIIYFQYRSPDLQSRRIVDYLAIARAVSEGDQRTAEKRSKTHVRDVAETVRQIEALHRGRAEWCV
jgi:DNA-binding GntR family transcriptional regulator